MPEQDAAASASRVVSTFLERRQEQIAQRWSRAVAASAARLREVGRLLSEGRAPEPSDAVTVAVSEYRAALDEAARREPLPADIAWRLFSAGFALDQFRRDLTDLRERAQEFASARKQDTAS